MGYDERIKAGKPCQRCGENCVAFLQGKTSDLFWMMWPGGKEQSGYVPPDHLCGVRAGGDSDYMNLNLCLACGQVQGEWPKVSVKKWLSNRPLKRFTFAVLINGGTWDETVVDAQDAAAAEKKIYQGLESAGELYVAGMLLMHEGELEEGE